MKQICNVVRYTIDLLSITNFIIFFRGFVREGCLGGSISWKFRRFGILLGNAAVAVSEDGAFFLMNPSRPAYYRPLILITLRRFSFLRAAYVFVSKCGRQ